MKIIIFSDSHGDLSTLIDIMEQNKDGDLFLFLGDGEREFFELEYIYPHKKMKAVRGNNDWKIEKTFDCFSIDKRKILMTHGHIDVSVKFGLNKLEKLAESKKVDIVLFGHTHKAYIKRVNDILYMNPGSILKFPRGISTYGIIEIIEGELYPKILEI